MLNASLLWFTGMSGTGKTTLLNKLNKILKNKGFTTFTIDGDQHRNKTKRKDFSKNSILQNNREIIKICLNNKHKYNFIIVSIISPYEELRNEARNIYGDEFKLIYMKAELNTLIKRDTKGLYKKAIIGEINNLIVYSQNSSYEIPNNPDLTINTSNAYLFTSDTGVSIK